MNAFEYVTNLQYKVKELGRQVEAFLSGEEYTRMEQEYKKTIKSLEREIRHLKAGLAAAHAETARVRNYWYGTCEDVIKEKERELARKDREVKKAREAMYQAQRQRDEALEKLREKRRRLYEIETQLEEEKGKNLELTARVDRDYTNSSKSSSLNPAIKRSTTGGKKPDGSRAASRGTRTMGGNAGNRQKS